MKTDCLHEMYTADAACSLAATYFGNIAAVEAALKPWKRAGCPRSGMEDGKEGGKIKVIKRRLCNIFNYLKRGCVRDL